MTLAQQHRLDTLSAALLTGGTVIGTIANYFTRQGFWQPHLPRAAFITMLVITPLFFGQVYYISQGRRWAKLLYVALTGIGMIGSILDYDHLAARYLTSTGAAINYFSQNALALIVVVMLVSTLRNPTPEAVEAEEYY